MFWEALLPYRGLTGRSALQMPFSLCLSKKKRIPRPRHAQNAGAEGGLLFGGLKPFSLCLSVKRQSWTTPQTSVPVMAISPCLSKEKQFQATEPSGAPQPFRALRSPMCIPATEPCRVPRESLSSTGKGKSGSQAPQDGLFLDRQGEKGLASARHVPMIAVSSTGRGERESQAHAMFP